MSERVNAASNELRWGEEDIEWGKEKLVNSAVKSGKKVYKTKNRCHQSLNNLFHLKAHDLFKLNEQQARKNWFKLVEYGQGKYIKNILVQKEQTPKVSIFTKQTSTWLMQLLDYATIPWTLISLVNKNNP